MNNGEFEVGILDKNGQIVGKKLRKDIVKGQDIYHAVYGILKTPAGKIAISLIGNPEGMPNLHAGSYGCTAATILRVNESSSDAMQRAVEDELKLSDVEVELIFEQIIEVDNTYRKIGLYQFVSEVPADFNREDIEEIEVYSEEEFRQLAQKKPEKITPVLRMFLESLAK